MAKGDVPDAEAVKTVDKADVPFDGVTVFHAEENRMFACPRDPVDIVGMEGDLHPARITLHCGVDGVDDPAGGCGCFSVTGGVSAGLADEHAKEDPVETSFVHPREINFRTFGKRIVPHTKLKTGIHEVQRRVGMAVDGDQLLMDPGNLRGGIGPGGAGTA